MQKFDTVIFDLGNVLIDWNVNYLYDKIFTNPSERDYFLSNICTSEWHAQQDAGRPVTEATEELIQKHPEWTEQIKAFYTRWREMFGGPIDGSVQLLHELKTAGYKLYALTNWSAELFYEALKDYEFLNWFDGRVVSGEERINKPERKLYEILVSRYHIDPATAVFIDDKEANVATARSLGLDGIVFGSPAQLRAELQLRGIL
jgi:2-haloacid dehalogenase